MARVTTTELRTRFAAALSRLYGAEVPAYTTLLQLAQEVNARVLTEQGAEAERLGSINRVSAERHGAIRVGTREELAQVARIFGALGMAPAGFYDLRDARPRPVPVVSTAFRPLSRAELAHNPFRVFTSMLVPQDRRFFSADLEQRVTAFLSARRLFPDELLELADVAEEHGELSPADAEKFIELAQASFALSAEPVNRAWYTELEKVSSVAADIAGVTSTHINHLTPRVLDIDDLYDQMGRLGIEMIDRIQGPPRWNGPDVLLRQTSFRALAEPRTFTDEAGALSDGTLRVRFGEVESRGIALTPEGRDLYDELVTIIDQRAADQPDTDRSDVAAQVWAEGMPRTERELCVSGLGFFTYQLTEQTPPGEPPTTVRKLIDASWITPNPIVYEDFLPRSAAGIFASNLTDGGQRRDDEQSANRDAGWLADAMGREIAQPELIYAEESDASLRQIEKLLDIDVNR